MILMLKVVAVILGLWWYDTDAGGCGGDLVVILVLAVVTALMVLMVVGCGCGCACIQVYSKSADQINTYPSRLPVVFLARAAVPLNFQDFA
jgi:hypothetical protein